MVVGIAIDDAATKVRDARDGFAFEQVKKIGGQRAALGILYVWQKFAGPKRTSQVPLQVALGEGMRKIQERNIDFRQQTAKALKQFQRMRICLGKHRAGQKCQQPDQSPGAISKLRFRKQFARGGRMDPRKRKMGSALRRDE